MSDRAWQAAWDAAHPEAIRAMRQRAVARRKERVASDPAYAERRRALQRASYERHKEERLAKGRAWVERNHEKVLGWASDRYYRTDPRKRFALRANRKVVTYGRPDDILDWQTIPDGPWSCTYCGVACESWDHVDPLSTGGANLATNLVPSCLPCNQKRTSAALRALVPLYTHCRRGHEFTPENTRIGSRGERRCRACAVILRRRAA